MKVGFILTLASIALIPFLLFVDGGIAQSGLTALSAMALAMTALHLKATEIDHLRPVLPRIVIAALLPAAWMLVQILPLGVFGLGHPIWASASTALGSKLFASVSVDPGTTLIMVGSYAGFVALGLAVSIITIERPAAEWTLFTLLAASTAVAILVLSRPNIIIDSTLPSVQSGKLTSALTIVAIGCVIAVATAVRAYERSETRKRGPGWLVLTAAMPGISIGAAAFVLCTLALIRFGQTYIVAATIVGVGAFAALALIRRLGFGVWGMAAIGIALAAIAFAMFNQTNIIRSNNLLLAFVNPGKDSGTAARMLADIRWGGNGAGTFAELAQLYRDIDEVTADATSVVSTVALMAIELGWPVLILMGVGVAFLTVMLLRATIRRGRDFSFLRPARHQYLSLVLRRSVIPRY